MNFLLGKARSLKPEWLLGLVFISSLLLILGALGYQHLGGLQPCELCYKQRWVYYAAISAVPIALFFYGRGLMAAMRILLFVLAAAFLANMILGIYHAGIEWKWWAGPSACSELGPLDATIDLLEALKTAKVVPCDQVQWTLFGLSMAGYSAIASFGLAIICAFVSQAAVKIK